MSAFLKLLLSCAMAMTGCLPAAMAATPAPAPAVAQETAGDALPLRARAQAIVAAFAAETARARGASLGDGPAVEVKNTPQLITFDFQSDTLAVPDWDTQPAGLHEMFKTFAGGGDADAERFFRAFFNRFLVAHEAGHWLQYRTWKGGSPDLYKFEQDANQLAVAFWRTQPGGEAFLAELQRLAEGAVAALPDPTPHGEDPAAYFGANYAALGADPLKYGYYQFRFMADALRMRERLDFARMASREHSGSDLKLSE